MKDHGHRRDDPTPERQSHVARQSDMDKTRSSASRKADILARLGYQQQSRAESDNRSESVPDVQIRAGEDTQAHIERISSYLRGANSDPDERVRMEVVRELERIATANPGLVPLERFMRALGDKYPQVQATAVQALTSLGASWLSNDLIAFLIKKLADKQKREDDLVRIAIMQLLATLGERSAVPALVAELDEEDWQVCETAILALGSFINVLSSPQRKKLIDKLYDENYFVREAAIIALKDHWPIEDLLKDLRSYPNAGQEAQAARVLGEIGQIKNPTIVQALIEVVEKVEAKSATRATALLALRQLHAPIPKTLLSGLLHDNNEEVRHAAEMLADGPDIYKL